MAGHSAGTGWSADGPRPAARPTPPRAGSRGTDLPVRVDVDVAHLTGLLHVGPAAAGDPQSQALGALVLSKAAPLALVGRALAGLLRLVRAEAEVRSLLTSHVMGVK